MKKPDNFKDFLISDQTIQATADKSRMQISAGVANALTTPALHALGLVSLSQQEKFANTVSEIVHSEDFIDEISEAISAPSENESEDTFIARAKLTIKNRLRDRLS